MDTDDLLQQACDYQRSGDWDDAIAIFDQIAADPNDPNSIYARNVAGELRERQRMGGSTQVESGIRVHERDVLMTPDAELPEACFRCGSNEDLGAGSVRVMARGIPLITFDKDVGTFHVPVCRPCRARKRRTRTIGVLCLVSVVLLPIGAFLLLRRWDHTTAWYDGRTIRIPNAPRSFRDAIPTVGSDSD